MDRRPLPPLKQPSPRAPPLPDVRLANRPAANHRSSTTIHRPKSIAKIHRPNPPTKIHRPPAQTSNHRQQSTTHRPPPTTHHPPPTTIPLKSLACWIAARFRK